jgi:hypothetical protein
MATVVSEPDQYRLLTFQVPNLMSLFHCLGCTKVTVQVRSMCSCFVTQLDFKVRTCQHLAQPQAGKPPLVGCPQMFIQYIHSYPPYWRPFLHPQLGDAPCCGDGPTYHRHSRHHKGDMKQDPYGGPTNIMHHLIKFIHHGDLAPGILAVHYMAHQKVQIACLCLHKTTVKKSIQITNLLPQWQGSNYDFFAW